MQFSSLKVSEAAKDLLWLPLIWHEPRWEYTGNFHWVSHGCLVVSSDPNLLEFCNMAPWMSSYNRSDFSPENVPSFENSIPKIFFKPISSQWFTSAIIHPSNPALQYFLLWVRHSKVLWSYDGKQLPAINSRPDQHSVHSHRSNSHIHSNNLTRLRLACIELTPQPRALDIHQIVQLGAGGYISGHIGWFLLAYSYISCLAILLKIGRWSGMESLYDRQCQLPW